MRIVSDVKPQRLQYVEQTKESLIEAAERLFIAEGYQRTTLDAVGAAARFTKGAVYRHFKDKRSLFEAVFERVAVTTLRDLLDDYEPLDDGWQSGLHSVARYLQVCSETRYRRVILEEGPTALGLSRWRELDQQYAGRVLEQILADLMKRRELPEYPVELLASLCCAVIGEGVLQIAAADDPARTRAETLAILTKLLSGLRVSAGAS